MYIINSILIFYLFVVIFRCTFLFQRVVCDIMRDFKLLLLYYTGAILNSIAIYYQLHIYLIYLLSFLDVLFFQRVVCDMRDFQLLLLYWCHSQFHC